MAAVTCGNCGIDLGTNLAPEERGRCPNCGSTARNFAVRAEERVELRDHVSATVFRAAYLQAFALITEACDEVERQGHPRPILVGGAAAEFYTGGAITSGDFDFVTPEHTPFENVLPKYGFIEEERPGRRMRSFRHPALGVTAEVISDSLYEGSDVDRVRLISVSEGVRIAILSIEDLIADRLCQYEEEPDRSEMLGQAVMLFKFAQASDMEYLNKRIREQTGGEWTLARLKEQVDDRNQP